MQGFVDVHCHLVYGVDDGPKTFQESATMLERARDDGVRAIVATAHIQPGVVEFQTEDYLDRIDELRDYSAGHGLNVRILTGAEIYYTALTCNFLREGRVPPLGESEHVLVEFSPAVRYRELSDALEGILRSGYQPVLAHVERYECLIGSTKRMREIKRHYETALQMNCSSVLGGKGWYRDRLARRALDDGLIDVVASDAHNASSRPTKMRATYNLLQQRYGETTARHLTGMDWLNEEI